MSVLLIRSARRSSIAAAPTVAVSALASASTHASTITTRVRSGPPTVVTRVSRAVLPPLRSTRADAVPPRCTSRALPAAIFRVRDRGPGACGPSPVSSVRGDCHCVISPPAGP
jgi:hypothetical protein